MAAIADSFRKMYDFVKDTIIDNSPFGSLTEDDEYGEDGYEYYEDGNAVREIAPSYTPISTIEKHNETKVVSHPSINRGGNEVIVIEPRSFDDAATIVQHLKDRKIVMLNLHLLDKEQSQRTIDFVCGASQALNGSPKKVGDLVFVFAPSNVTLSADATPQQNKFNDSLWRTSLQ
ncbi:MAG: cell division protein SepF [Cyanobacteria bacterium SIG26]|nr:cell division protein SepF [Cyanobacteria bacterium SIG26]